MSNKVLRFIGLILAGLVVFIGLGWFVYYRYDVAMIENIKLEKSYLKVQSKYDSMVKKTAERIYYVNSDGSLSESAFDQTSQLIDDTLTKMFTYRNSDEFRQSYVDVENVLDKSGYVNQFYGSMDATISAIELNGISSRLSELTIVKQDDSQYIAIVDVKRESNSSKDVESDEYVFYITIGDKGLIINKTNI